MYPLLLSSRTTFLPEKMCCDHVKLLEVLLSIVVLSNDNTFVLWTLEVKGHRDKNGFNVSTK